MGTSKSYRGAPGWESQNTPKGKAKVSKGSKSTAEGTHQSGYDDKSRKGVGAGARKKSKTGRVPVKAKVTTGQS